MAKVVAKKKTYSEDNIERHAGLKGVQKKPSMYAGTMDSTGVWTLAREILDNTIDQALAGRNKLTHFIEDPNGKGYWIVDAGEGIPVGKKKFEDEMGRVETHSVLFVVTGLLHAGANFDSDQISRGTHGIGQKLTNALSNVFNVWTNRDNTWWTIGYKKAKLTTNVTKTKAPKLPHGVKVKKGTVVYFEPDLSYFLPGSKMQIEFFHDWATITSYLVPGLEIRHSDKKGKETVYKTKGISEYVSVELEKHKATQYGKTFVHQDKGIDVAIAFSNAETTSIAAYTNGLGNSEGGEHEKAVYDALTKSLTPYKGKLEYKPADLKDGILGLVNCKIAAPQFSNQVKAKLIDQRAYDMCYPSTLKAFEAFWKANKGMAVDICKRAAELRKKTADFLNDKKLLKNVKGASKGLSAKFSDINNSKTPVSERELYIVEGDSAGGTAKQARDNSFQATFAIRGKPLNVMEAAKDKINANKEIAGIFAGIGFGMNAKDVNDIRFGKIILLADPDVDGCHINCLLLTLFWKYVPHLFEEGKIFLLKSPEYYADYKGQTYYGMTKDDLYKKVGTTKVDARHIKGWGELDAIKMAPIAFEKGVRELIRILPPRDKKGVDDFVSLMGKDSTFRQKLLGVLRVIDNPVEKAKPAARRKLPREIEAKPAKAKKAVAKKKPAKKKAR